jgi:citrate synthase
MVNKTAHMTWDDQPSFELPIYTPTLGKQVIDISTLGQQGAFTYDPGFMSTAACESKITYINGEKGILLHRGYPIDQLAEKKQFLDVAYALVYGDLPTNNEKQVFEALIKKFSNVDPSIIQLLKSLPQNAHPMGMLMSMTSAWSAIHHLNYDANNLKHRENAVIEMIAKIPTLSAMCYRHSIGQDFIAPDENLSYAANFLYMMFGQKPHDTLAHAMDVIFTLHADHEQNASTSTVRLSGSTGTDPIAAMTAGISALWGPAHGGANEACLNMLKKIADIAKIPEYINKAKDKNDPFRLMGFGHRVYKNYDPRATVMNKVCHDVLQTVNAHNTPLFQLAMELERIALEDSYFVERKLYPNIDFYSGITLSAMNIPTNMFTVIFALARTSGWMAQWLEMTASPLKIGRPRQLYTGEKQRDI